ncbi:MAG: tRNA pseudouridine synthase A [Bacteroidota bacterium]
MQTIRLRVNNRIYKNLMWFLGKFNKEEIQVIEEDNEFLSVQEYLEKELKMLETGTSELVSIDDIESHLETTIKKHEG